MTGTISVGTFPLPTAQVTVVDLAFHQRGDINWDGFIDDLDISLAQAAFNSKPGDKNWNPDADLNGDGLVNMKDIAMVVQNFGAQAPVYTAPFTANVSAGKCVLNVAGIPYVAASQAQTTVVEGQQKYVLLVTFGPMSIALEPPVPVTAPIAPALPKPSV